MGILNLLDKLVQFQALRRQDKLLRSLIIEHNHYLGIASYNWDLGAIRVGRIRDALHNGANPNQKITVGGQSHTLLNGLLRGSGVAVGQNRFSAGSQTVHAARMLMSHGACIDQDTVTALALLGNRSAPIKQVSVPATPHTHGEDMWVSLAQQCMAQEPKLDWYAPVGVSGLTALHYDALPANMLIEIVAHGFNNDIARLREYPDKAFSPEPQSFDDPIERDEALADLFMNDPQLQWLGGRSRRDIAKTLLKEGADPNGVTPLARTVTLSNGKQMAPADLHVDEPSMRLLAKAFQWGDVELFGILLDHGAQAEPAMRQIEHILYQQVSGVFPTSNSMSVNKREQCLELLCRQVGIDWSQLIESEQDTDITRAGLINKAYPKLMAQIEQTILEKETPAPMGGTARRGARL